MAVRPTVTDPDRLGKELVAASPDLLGSMVKGAETLRRRLHVGAGTARGLVAQLRSDTHVAPRQCG
jgi:hypothetical protein